MGGKNTNIDGYMPKSISYDGGKTWEKSRTPFPALSVNQRPSILRLASGNLFFAGDFQDYEGRQPQGMKEKGSYVALSEDEGQGWHIKKLYGAQTHENPAHMGGETTIGYSAACQSPNGIIHLITTMNEPCLHFEMNEAWIKDGDICQVDEEEIMRSNANNILEVREYRENYLSGSLKAVWSGGIADDGRFLLHGKETWYYANGQKQRETYYELGQKVNRDVYWDEDGKKMWSWEYDKSGRAVWTQWWSNGTKKSQSVWKGFHADGTAVCWNRDGEIISKKDFNM